MSFSRIWGFFKTPSYQLVNAVDDAPDIEANTSETFDENDAAIEVAPEAHAELNEAANVITARQVLAALCTVIFARENRPRIIAASILTTINTALNYVAPYLLGKTMESTETEIRGYKVDLMTLTFMLIAVDTMNQLLPNFIDRILTPVNANNVRQLVTSVTEHQLNESSDYHATTPFGSQVFFLQKGFSAAQTGAPLLTKVAPAIFQIIMAAGALSYRFGYGMGAGIVGVAATYTGYTWVTTPHIIDARDIQRKKGNAAWEKISHVIKQYKNIHDYGQYAFEMESLHKAVTDIATAEIDSITTSLKIDQGHIIIPRLGMMIACLYVADSITHRSSFTLQDFLLLITYLGKLAMLVPSVGKALNDLFAAWPDLKFVFNELAKPSKIIDDYPDVPLDTNGKSASIRFENVTFGYPNKPPIFKNLSFAVESGQAVTLVSKSGGGKSTIFKLLFRYNNPSEGKIFINDQDISMVSLVELRKNIGLIAQNPNLFNGTVRENIRYGAENPQAVTDEKIWQLAEKANLTEFLKSLDRGYHIQLSAEKPKHIEDEAKIYVYLANHKPMYALKIAPCDQYPRGGILHGQIKNHADMKEEKENDLSENYRRLLQNCQSSFVDKESKDKLLDLLLERKHITEKRLDNSVGEDGKALSGGEQQRVAILRGLFKPCVIRLFDEVTAALDIITADKVLDGIGEITQGQTKITITHKLSEAQSSKIIVIDKGTVVAQGKHDELLQSCQLYKDLWNAQSLNSTPAPTRMM